MDKPRLSPTYDLEANEVKPGRSSILKPIRPRTPFQELSFGCSNENYEVTIRQRRVSFSGKNIVKEFCSKTHSQQITNVPTYEESFQISDTSESNVNSTSKDSSINQSFFAEKLEASNESNVMEESMDITSNSVHEILKMKEGTAENQSQEDENCNSSDSVNMSLTTVLPRFKETRIKRSHSEDQNVESNGPVRYANRCSRLYNEADSSGMEFTEAIPAMTFPSRKASINDFDTSMEMTNVTRLPTMGPFSSQGMESKRQPISPCVQPRKSQALDFSPAPKNHSDMEQTQIRHSVKPSLNLEISGLDVTSTEIQKPRPSRKSKASLAFKPQDPLLEESMAFNLEVSDLDLTNDIQPSRKSKASSAFKLQDPSEETKPLNLEVSDLDLTNTETQKPRPSRMSKPFASQSPLMEESFTKIRCEDMDLSVPSFQPTEPSNDQKFLKKSEFEGCSEEFGNDDMDISTAIKFRDSELSLLEPNMDNDKKSRASVFSVKDMDISVVSKKPEESCLAFPLEMTGKSDHLSISDIRACNEITLAYPLEKSGPIEAENDVQMRKSKFSMQSTFEYELPEVRESEVMPELPKRSVSPKFSLGVSSFDVSNATTNVGPRKSKFSLGSPLSEQPENEVDSSIDLTNVLPHIDPQKSKISLKRKEKKEDSIEPRKSKVSLGFPNSENTGGSAAMDMSNIHSQIDPRKSKASFGFHSSKHPEDEAPPASEVLPQLDPQKVSLGFPHSENTEGRSAAMDLSSIHPQIDPRKSKVSFGFQPKERDPRKSKVSLGFLHSEQSVEGSADMDMSNIDPRKSKVSFGLPVLENPEVESSIDLTNIHPHTEKELAQDKEEVNVDLQKSKFSFGFPIEPSENREGGSAAMDLSNTDLQKSKFSFNPRKSKASLAYSEKTSGSAMDISNIEARKSGLPLENEETSELEAHPLFKSLKSKLSLGFPSSRPSENEETGATSPKSSLGFPLSEQSENGGMDLSSIHLKNGDSLQKHQDNEDQIDQNSMVLMATSPFSEKSLKSFGQSKFSVGFPSGVHPRKSMIPALNQSENELGNSVQSFEQSDVHCQNEVKPFSLRKSYRSTLPSNSVTEASSKQVQDSENETDFAQPQDIDLETTIESLTLNETCDKMKENSSPIRTRGSTLIHSPIHHEDSPKLRVKRKKTLKPTFSDGEDIKNSISNESAEVMDVSDVPEPDIEKLEKSLNDIVMDEKERPLPTKPQIPKTPQRFSSKPEIIYEKEPPYEIRIKNLKFMKEREFMPRSDSKWKFEICPFFYLVIETPLVEISNRTAILEVYFWCNPIRQNDNHLKFVVYNFQKQFSEVEMTRSCNTVEKLDQIVDRSKEFWRKLQPVYNALNVLDQIYPYSITDNRVKFSVITYLPTVDIDVFIDLSQFEGHLGPKSITVIKKRGDINEKIIAALFPQSAVEPFTFVNYVKGVKEFCLIFPKK